ncbi:MAG: protein kinase [Polyangia bacterium]
MFTGGQILAGRYVIERHAGAGGMGSVFRALDQKTNQPVALKVIHSVASRAERAGDTERFGREARLLAELRHEAIVGYVDHGIGEGGRPYLAMEWLEGEDLAERLHRGPLSLWESVRLVRRVSEALAVAHGRGIVHRDIKPSNLLLRGGDIARATVVDFGIARRGMSPTQRMTQTGYLVGTPEYMAPEQARGEPVLTPAVDIFALGCVWFECLTGRPPFQSEHLAAVLAKVLFEPAPPLRQLRPGLPGEVDALLSRMLEKDPRRRPAGSGELADELSSLGELAGPADAVLPLARTQPGPVASPAQEQRLVTVLLSTPLIRGDGATLESGRGAAEAHPLDSVRAALAPLGAQMQPLADGSVVITLLPERGEATDLAALAARGALLLRERWPAATVALATGRGVVSDRMPLGEAFDRAGRLLQAEPVETEPQKGDSSGRILLDDLTADLLGARFVLERSQGGNSALLGESPVDASRPLLGKPTPFLGREQELALLEATLSACVEESTAKAVIVLGAAGLGKSRLRHEFLRRLESRGSEGTLLFGRGDPLRGGQAYALLGQALRRLCGVRESDPPEASRERLQQRLGQHLAADAAARVIEFLCEAAGYPGPDEQSPWLRAARREPAQMSQQIAQAVADFLRAECAVRPVLIVLDDLQWGDAPTVRAIESAFAGMPDTPLTVLALGRPEAEGLFPRLFAGHAMPIPLQPLSRRAGERLAQQILGRGTPPQALARIVEQSAGNPLYLEELIRAVAEGRGDDLPPTVLAMLQARLGALPASERRALRAASVFGELCWAGGIQALTGAPSDEVAYSLAALVSAELLTARRQSRFAGETEYGFRHVVAREAAYSLLTDEERRRAHLQASAFLESAGEQDARVLAEHLQLGGELDRAQQLFAAAATRAFRYGHLDEVLLLCERGQRCSSESTAPEKAQHARGLLYGLEARARAFRGELALALAAADESLARLAPQSAPWYEVLGSALLGASLSEEPAAIRRLLKLAEATPPAAGAEGEARAAYAQVAVSAMNIYAAVGAHQAGRLLIEVAEAAVAPIAAVEPLARGDVLFLRARFLSLLGADPWQQRELATAAAACFHEAANPRMVGFAQLVCSDALIALAEHAEAVALLRGVFELAQRRHERLLTLWTRTFLAEALLAGAEPSTERIAEAQALLAPLLEDPRAPGLLRGIAYLHQSAAERLNGNLQRARGLAQEGLAQLRRAPAFLNRAYRELLVCALASGDVAAACAVADEAMSHLRQRGELAFWDLSLRRACAAAYTAGGAPSRAEPCRSEALAALHAVLARAPDEGARQRALALWQRDAGVG